MKQWQIYYAGQLNPFSWLSIKLIIATGCCRQQNFTAWALIIYFSFLQYQEAAPENCWMQLVHLSRLMNLIRRKKCCQNLQSLVSRMLGSRLYLMRLLVRKEQL